MKGKGLSIDELHELIRPVLQRLPDEESPAPAPVRPAGELERWRDKGIPKPLLELVASDRLLPTQSLHGARQWRPRGRARRQPRLMVLHGWVGCGKSTAAAWWLTQHTSGRWCSSARLARLPCGPGMPQWATRELEQLEQASHLVIDDVGWQDADPATGLLATPVQQVLLQRWEHWRPTLCTSNLAPAAALERAGAGGRSWEEYLGEDRLRSRWQAAGRGHISQDDDLRVRAPRR